MNTHIVKMLAVGMMGCYAIQTSADTSAARRYIQQNYYKPLPQGAESLPYAEFDKLLDKWTWIVPRDRWERMNESIRGEQKGRVGITIEDHPLGKRVTYVNPGAPGYYSGLLVGDVIQSVNGEPLLRKNTKGEYPEIRGKSGLPVMLEIQRGNRCINIFTQRANFQESAVTTMVIGRTLALQINAFNEGLHREFCEQTAHIDPTTIDTVIIDLRDNGGGLVDETMKMLSEFIAYDDTLLSVHYRDHVEYTTAELWGRWRDEDRTIIVLQNNGSASASEIMAGTLKARANAIIVGERSYGKGRMQRMVPRRYIGVTDTSIGGVIMTFALYRAGGILEVDERGIAADVPFTSHDVDVPSLHGVDVVALRMEHAYPSQTLIDSIARIGGPALVRQIWSGRVAPYTAVQDLNTIRHKLPIPAWKCVANHDTLATMFSHEDEQAIRKALVKGLARPLPDSVQRMEPLEALLKHMGITPHSVKESEHQASYAVVASVLHRYGIRLRQHRDAVVVDYVVPASPAYVAGMCVGDRIVTVRGSGVSHSADAQRMLASGGSGITQIEVRRGVRQFTLKVQVATSTAPTITVVHDHATGYIGFSVLTMQSVRDARDTIEQMDETGLASLILDMRGVDVGNVAAATELVNLFTRGGAFRGITPVVVVDSHTRGAAEYVAYMLQQSGDATIVGTATAGDMARRVDLGLGDRVPYVFTQALAVEDPARKVVPDHTMQSLVVDLDAVRAAAAHYRDVTHQRTSLWHATEINGEHIERLRNRLPDVYRRVEDGPLAEAVYGSIARYYQLQPVLRMLRGGRGLTQR